MSDSDFLVKLRSLMENCECLDGPIQAYIIPYNDEHMSEYLDESDKRLMYATGFTGSSGTAVVTELLALFWTDGRYFVQADKEIGPEWNLMKSDLPSTPSEIAWLEANLSPLSRVGVDPKLMAWNTWLEWEERLSNNGHSLIPVPENFVDIIWENKPKFIPKPIMNHPLKYCGLRFRSKMNMVKEKMNEKGADVLILAALDEIAWLLNLRGSDINYNPVFFAYLIITSESVIVFPKNTDLPIESFDEYAQYEIPVIVQPYEEVFEFIVNEILPRIAEIKRVWIPKSINYYFYYMIPENKRLAESSPVLFLKSIKNEKEVEGMIEAHVKDGVSLCRFFSWLETEVPKGAVSELSASEKLETFRRDEEHYVGPSFQTISSSGPNAAIHHYRPTKKTDRPLIQNEVYLCDAGCQYLHGTTDISRTLHFGTPTDFEKECFTRVMKGQIALATSTFPKGLKGSYLDSFARKYLWDIGLDYGHGTGHGVGAYLHVHEGPMAISRKNFPDDPGLHANMIVSNEPGFYLENSFGIRLENVVLTVPAETRYNFRDTGFLTFKTLSLVPFQRKMIKTELLTKEEIDHLNQYHQTCREVIGDKLKIRDYKDAYEWLLKETQSL